MISIGILAIGLTSVLSIIPAGKSEVSRALVYDRATALAANALADAATFGLLKPGSLAWSGSTMAVFDPTGAALWGASLASVKQAGIFSGSSSAAVAAGNQPAVLKLIAQGRDDVNYSTPATDDDLPKNQFPSAGPRAFQGRMSCILAVTGTATLSAGNFATLSAIVFHNRDLSSGGTTIVSGSWDGTASLSSIDTSQTPDRTLKEIVRPGTVIFTGTSFHQLAMAAIDDSSGAAYVTFSGASPTTSGSVQILLDSVGLAEQTVMLEGPGPWSQ